MTTAATPAVTCVLIFLDGARFIDEAIRSVVAQGADVDWELVLVDDGSADASTAIARRWAESDPARIRYIEHVGHANLGMSASRNAGVAAARGEYIGFLDCDDVWLQSALSHGLRVFAAHPAADVVIAGTWRWHGWTGDPADLSRDHVMSLPDATPHTVIEPPALLAAMYANPGAWRIPAMCSVLTTRRGLLRIGGLDDQFRGLYEDQVLYAKIALHLRAVIDPRPMALYRQHDASACQVAIDAGEWRRIGPSEPERRYLEWMRTYVTDAAGGDAAALDVVARNLDHAAHGGHVAPTEQSPSFVRRHVPDPARRALRAVRRRLRAGAPPTTVVGRWSEQFLAPVAGPSTATTLVIEAERGDEPWVARPPAVALAGPTSRRSWADALSTDATYDRIVVPFGVGTAIDTGSLVSAVGRHLAPSGTAIVVVPGPAFDPGRPDADVIADLVHSAVPHHRVAVESFGNAATADAIDRPAAELGPLVDRHDPAVPLVLALTISPTRCPR
jgi:hypothetical protein